MASSIAVVYVKDDVAIPKTLGECHHLWPNVLGIGQGCDTKVLLIKVRTDKGPPGEPNLFEDVYSGHDSYGASYLAGTHKGMTVLQLDVEGGGSGRTAKARTRREGVESEPDTSLVTIPNGEEDLALANCQVVLTSYDVTESDYNELLDRAKAFELPPPT